jgi:peptide-methionine (S)-S-oxide reductase
VEKATFAAGCFWSPELIYSRIHGVVETAVGYMGGTVELPSYEQVCAGTTGHAEVVQVSFDPQVISYGELLSTFWKIHDPTQLDRQGPDVGTQYRSVIFCHSPEQEATALASMERLQESGELTGELATRLEAATEFYRAEEYHQRYLEQRGMEPTCGHWGSS